MRLELDLEDDALIVNYSDTDNSTRQAMRNLLKNGRNAGAGQAAPWNGLGGITSTFANSTSGHGSKNEKQFAFREEIVPVADVKITFAGKKPARVRLVPGPKELTPVSNEIGWEVTLPPLGLHAVVSAEYEE